MTVRTPGRSATGTVSTTPTTMPPWPSSNVRDSQPAAAAAVRMALTVEAGAPAVKVTIIGLPPHCAGCADRAATAGQQKTEASAPAPALHSGLLGRLADHRLSSRQQRRGDV